MLLLPLLQVEGISADQPLEVVVPVEYQNEYGDTINKTYKVGRHMIQMTLPILLWFVFCAK